MTEFLRIISAHPTGALDADDPAGGRTIALLDTNAIAAAGGALPANVARLQRLRQLDVALLALAAEGMNDKEIARRIELPSPEIHQRWRIVRSILGAKDRAHAVAIALALHLIGPPTRALELLAEYLSARRD